MNEIYPINHTMQNYDFVEGVEFDALMPHVMEKVDTIGASDVNVPAQGFMALGADALEVVDPVAFFEPSTGSTTGSTTGTTC